jgi:predicted nucleic acid-binding protein
MIIISDTTPLRYLIEVGCVHILETLFGKVIVPQAVSGELQHEKTPRKIKDWMTNHPDWLELRQADISVFTPQKKIGAGEREAFALALELKADGVLLDDQGAMVEAERHHILAIPTFAILEQAAARDLLDLPLAAKAKPLSADQSRI